MEMRRGTRTHVFTHTHTHTQTNKHTHTQTHTDTHTQTHRHTQTHTDTHTHTQTHTQSHTHTITHTHTTHAGGTASRRACPRSGRSRRCGPHQAVRSLKKLHESKMSRQTQQCARPNHPVDQRRVQLAMLWRQQRRGKLPRFWYGAPYTC